MDISVTKYELLFRGTRDGFSDTEFHKRCDNKGATVVLVKSTSNHIFGGFAHTPWTSSSGGTSDPKAFLFSWNFKEIYSLSNKDDPYALYHCSGYGPIFGGSCDLFIASDCNVYQNSYSRLNKTYSTNGRSQKDITGGVDNGNGYYHFQVSEYEVWVVV
jgi:hypothetical protein